jgi:hypothetical protein
MAVHIPLTVEARTEAWKFMLSTNNFINSATGESILLPTQDMVLGSYYLTTDFQSKGAAFQISNALRKSKETNFSNFQMSNKSFLFFQNLSEVFSAYHRNEISLHTPIWIRLRGLVDFGKNSTRPIEMQLRKNGSLHQIFSKFTTFSASKPSHASPQETAALVTLAPFATLPSFSHREAWDGSVTGWKRWEKRGTASPFAERAEPSHASPEGTAPLALRWENH